MFTVSYFTYYTFFAYNNYQFWALHFYVCPMSHHWLGHFFRLFYRRTVKLAMVLGWWCQSTCSWLTVWCITQMRSQRQPSPLEDEDYLSEDNEASNSKRKKNKRPLNRPSLAKNRRQPRPCFFIAGSQLSFCFSKIMCPCQLHFAHPREWPFIFCFTTLRCIQAKINEQILNCCSGGQSLAKRIGSLWESSHRSTDRV